MPPTIGIQDLENQAWRIIQAVQEDMNEYIITIQGKPVALLRPFTAEDEQRLRQIEIETALAEMKSLAHQVAAAWTSTKSGVALIDEQRR